MSNKQQPMQPLTIDPKGRTRFKKNEIVEFLLSSDSKVTMNDIAMREFPDEDRQQFAQLIGYSLGGYLTLSYVDETAAEKAYAAEADFMRENDL